MEFDGGFLSYSYNDENRELYISKLFIGKKYREVKKVLEVTALIKKLAKTLGASHVTALVKLTPANRERFLKKLNLFNRLGLQPQTIVGEAIIVAREFKE